MFIVKKHTGMIRRFIGIVFILLSFQVSAQNNQAADSVSEKVYTYVDQMPEFPGGNDKIQVFLHKNIKYPPLAKQKKIEGRVHVEFIVDMTGQVQNVQVKRSADPVLDEEAVRVIKKMPLWNPGRQDGKAVNVSLIVPVEFKLVNASWN